MYAKNPITPEQREDIIKLFNEGGDNRAATISEKLSLSYSKVSSEISKYLSKKYPKIY